MRITILLITMMCGLSSLNGQTTISGGIYEDTNFTLENSPYIVTDNVVLFPDKTLTIEPGVEIKFDGEYYFEVRGNLIAIGDEANRISFTSNLSNPTMGDWLGIKIINSLGASASFEYCDFSYAYESNDTECCFEGGPIYYSHCKFLNNNYAIRGYTGYIIPIDNCEFRNNNYCISNADKVVTNSVFIDNVNGLNATERISVYNSYFSNNNIALFGGRGIVDSCIIENNTSGIEPLYEGFEIRNSHILNNDIGLKLSNYSGNVPPVKNNNICDNLTYNVENLDNLNKDLTENCWCTSDEEIINEKIYDGYDDIDLGLIEYNTDSTCDPISNVEESDVVKGSNITVSPNPFTSQIRFNFNTTIHECNLSILSLDGKIILNSNYSNINELDISLPNLKSGVYISYIKSGSSVYIKKIIKQ